MGTLAGPIIGGIAALGSAVIGGVQASKGRRAQERTQARAEAAQQAALKKQEDRIKKQERSVTQSLNENRRSLLAGRGRKKTLFGSAAGVEEENGLRATLG